MGQSDGEQSDERHETKYGRTSELLWRSRQTVAGGQTEHRGVRTSSGTHGATLAHSSNHRVQISPRSRKGKAALKHPAVEHVQTFLDLGIIIRIHSPTLPCTTFLDAKQNVDEVTSNLQSLPLPAVRRTVHIQGSIPCSSRGVAVSGG